MSYINYAMAYGRSKIAKILDEATDLVSILIDYDFWGTDFAITTHTDEYNVYCKKP